MGGKWDENKKKKLYSIKKSLSILIEICGDKPIDSYNISDANSFKSYFNKKPISKYVKTHSSKKGRRVERVRACFSVSLDGVSLLR